MKWNDRLVRVAIAVALLAPSVAMATLGASVNSSPLGHTSQFVSYTTQETVTDGYTLKEYVSKGGIVFAAVWNGMHHPDLSKLLGSYYAEHLKARSRLDKKGGRAPISIKSPHIVVEMGGHMRAVRGRAYVSALVPNGVSLEDIH